MDNYIRLKTKLLLAILNESNPIIQDDVGVLIATEKRKDRPRQFLLLKRAAGVKTNTWAMLSGRLEHGEPPIVGLKREVHEEIGIPESLNIINYNKIGVESTVDEINKIKKNFHFFVGLVKEPFKVTDQMLAKNENSRAEWFTIDNLPTPLYPGMVEKLRKLQ